MTNLSELTKGYFVVVRYGRLGEQFAYVFGKQIHKYRANSREWVGPLRRKDALILREATPGDLKRFKRAFEQGRFQ